MIYPQWQGGIISHWIPDIPANDFILNQTKAAFEILNKENPDNIITLGGDCAVSVVPFTYMATKYPDDVAIKIRSMLNRLPLLKD